MEELLNHIQKFITLNQTEVSLIMSGVEVRSFSKKEFLLETGDRADKLFFVSKGCLRMLFLSDKGNEVTTQFAIENWWLGDLLGFHNDTESVFSIQATEASEIIILQKAMLEKLLSGIPKLERYFRLCFEKTAGADQRRIRYLFTMSAEERYRNMNDSFPQFLQRVPNYMVASYLGLTPEFLSKIRAGKT